MPITRDQFEQGMNDDVAECIQSLRSFFERSESNDAAYSEQELQAEILRHSGAINIRVGYPKGEEPEWAVGYDRDQDRGSAQGQGSGQGGIKIQMPAEQFPAKTLKAALDDLVHSGFLASKSIAGDKYYIRANTASESE